MFNEPSFRETLRSSLGKGNDYVAYIYRKMRSWAEAIELAGLGKKKLREASNWND